MAIIPRKDLKKVFGGVSSILLQKDRINLNPGSGSVVAIDPDFDLPVTVDELTLNGGTPSVNHYKVYGTDVDWYSTSEAGEAEVNLFIPSVADDLLEYVFGEDAVSSITGATLGTDTYNGIGVTTKKVKLENSIVIMNEAKTHLFVIASGAMFASYEFNNNVLGIRITGTIEGDGDSSDFAILEKQTSTSGD